MDNFEFLGLNLPKNGFWGRYFKNLSLDLESVSLRYYLYQFSDKTDNFDFLGPNLPRNGFWGRNFKNLSLDLESASVRYFVHQFFRQNGKLWIFGSEFSLKWILGTEFQKSKSGFGINTSKILEVPILSQNRQLLIFWPKFGEISQLRAIFWFKYCWGCCREAEMSWVEVDEAGWSWVEVDGAGWFAINSCQ